MSNPKKEIDNLKKDLVDGWDKVIFWVKDPEMKSDLIKELRKHVGNSLYQIAEIKLLRDSIQAGKHVL